MKKNIIFLIVLFYTAIMLQSCGQTKNEYDIISQNYPRIDGSTSTLPIVQEMYKNFHTPEIVDGEEVWQKLPDSASQTFISYGMLINGEMDFIIVPAPSEEVRRLAEEKGVELEYIPVCLEALVYITHKNNTADNITTEQIKSIYTDMQINNWSNLGGEDKWIEALVRNEDSGSHALMGKFVLNGEEVNEIIVNNTMIMSMFGMIDEVENYINLNSGGNRIPLGYTIYYFFQNNKEEQNWNNVKLLNIDGIEPNNQTIASGEYPYSTNYYAVIRSDTLKDSPSRKLISWLLSDEGQQICVNSGFGSIKR